VRQTCVRRAPQELIDQPCGAGPEAGGNPLVGQSQDCGVCWSGRTWLFADGWHTFDLPSPW